MPLQWEYSTELGNLVTLSPFLACPLVFVYYHSQTHAVFGCTKNELLQAMKSPGTKAKHFPLWHMYTDTGFWYSSLVQRCLDINRLFACFQMYLLLRVYCIICSIIIVLFQLHPCQVLYSEYLASFPGLLHLQFLIACSMQKLEV